MPTPTIALRPKAQKLLAYIAQGHSSEDIAQALAIKRATVKVHIRKLFRQLAVSNRIEAALVARSMGLIQPGFTSLLRNLKIDEEEQLLLSLAARGLDYPQIAQEMGRTTRHVRYLMTRLFAKLAVKRRELAVVKAIYLGLIQAPDRAN